MPFLLSGYKHEMMFANTGEGRIWESENKNCQVLASTNILSLKSILESNVVNLYKNLAL